jgi:hypothetical protein
MPSWHRRRSLRSQQSRWLQLHQHGQRHKAPQEHDQRLIWTCTAGFELVCQLLQSRPICPCARNGWTDVEHQTPARFEVRVFQAAVLAQLPVPMFAMTSRYMPSPPVCLSPAGLPLCFLFYARVRQCREYLSCDGISGAVFGRYRHGYQHFVGMSCCEAIAGETRKNPRRQEACGFLRLCEAV